MKTYAFIQNCQVVEIIAPVLNAEGQDVAISERFTPEFVAAMVDITELSVAPEVGWAYDGSVFLRPVVPTAVDVLSAMAFAMTGAVQAYMDTQARALGYDSLLSAISYAEEPAVPRFQADGLAFRAWRSLVWSQCHALLAQVQAGTLAVPTEVELLAMLPPAPVIQPV